MIFFERHLLNINSLVLSNKNFLLQSTIFRGFIFVGDSNFVSTTVISFKARCYQLMKLLFRSPIIWPDKKTARLKFKRYSTRYTLCFVSFVENHLELMTFFENTRALNSNFFEQSNYSK